MPNENLRPKRVNRFAKSRGSTIFSVTKISYCHSRRGPACSTQVQAVNLFLVGDADADLAAQYMPPPAWLRQGRKAFQLKNKMLFKRAMQDPKWAASSRETLSPSGPRKKQGCWE